MVLLILRVLEVPRKCVRWALFMAQTCRGGVGRVKAYLSLCGVTSRAQPSDALSEAQKLRAAVSSEVFTYFRAGRWGNSLGMSRAFLATCGLRADEGDSLKVYDLVRGLEVVELAGHPDHVMCGSMS